MTVPRWTSMQWLAALVRIGAGQVVAQGHRIPDEVGQLLAAIESADQFDDKLSHIGTTVATRVELVDPVRDGGEDTGAPLLLTRTEVAELAGVSKRTVTRWHLDRVGNKYPSATVYEYLKGR